MKRLLVLSLVMLFVVSGWSQDRLGEIRRLYASAQEGVKHQRLEDDLPLSKLEMKYTRMEPAMGAVKYEQELYLMTNEQYCGFYRSKRTAGPYEPTYEEALYDRTGQVMFCYRKESFIFDDNIWRYEERFYWNEDGSLLKVMRKATWADGKDRPLTAEDYQTSPSEMRASCEAFYQAHASLLTVPEIEDGEGY